MKRRTHRRSCLLDALEPRRLFAAGALDTSFSNDGRQTISLSTGRTLEAADVAVQVDGKTVIVGKFTTPGRTDFGVVRLNIDGTIDQTFNTNGPDGPGFVRTGMGNDGKSRASGVAIQADGKIVVVGTAFVTSGLNENELAIARYHANGTLDGSFDDDGKRTMDLGVLRSETIGAKVVIQPDGKIVCTGETTRTLDDDFFTVRFNSDGKFDRTFNGDGKAFTGFDGTDGGKAVRIDTNGTPATNNLFGSVVVAGNVGTRKVGLVRFDKNGSESEEFDHGKREFQIPGAQATRVADLLIQPDGKVVIVGHVNRLNALGDMYVARFNRNGALDTTFGTRGTGFDFVDFGGSETGGGIVKAPTGTGFIVSGRFNCFVAAKFTENGLIDTTFGSGGKVRLNFGGTARIAAGPGKRLTLAGGSLFASARILDTGANVVAAGSFQPNAFEQGQRVSGFVVTRSERLPFPTRVFFSVTGTALVNRLFFPTQPNPNDYTVSGMTIPPPVFNAGPAYVDIPAGQNFVGVTLTPIDDTRVEGNETAIFTILPNSSYDIGSNEGARINIFDNDGTTLNTTADAFVRDGTSANTNFGAGGDIQIKRAGDGFNRQAFIKFDLTSVSTINSARLKLFGGLSANEGSGLVTQVFGAGSNWSETGLKFSNKPGLTTGALASATIFDSTKRSYEFDVTSFLRAEKLAGRNIVTFVFINPANSSASVNFGSRESGNGPQLVIG